MQTPVRSAFATHQRQGGDRMAMQPRRLPASTSWMGTRQLSAVPGLHHRTFAGLHPSSVAVAAAGKQGRGREGGAVEVAEHATQIAGELAAEKVVEKPTEQAGARVQGNGSQRLALAGVTLTQRALSAVAARAMTRMLRCFSVCLPALGGLFCLYLARLDARAMVDEVRDSNLAAGAAFSLALVCDVADVLSHLIVTAALLHQHFGFGLSVGRATLAAVDGGGLAIALLGTVAALYGELLGLGSRRRQYPYSTAAAAAATAAA